jgi:hypothetical protein
MLNMYNYTVSELTSISRRETDCTLASCMGTAAGPPTHASLLCFFGKATGKMSCTATISDDNIICIVSRYIAVLCSPSV